MPGKATKLLKTENLIFTLTILCLYNVKVEYKLKVCWPQLDQLKFPFERRVCVTVIVFYFERLKIHVLDQSSRCSVPNFNYKL